MLLPLLCCLQVAASHDQSRLLSLVPKELLLCVMSEAARPISSWVSA